MYNLVLFGDIGIYICRNLYLETVFIGIPFNQILRFK